MVRAKFRCIEVTKTWEKTATARFLPVMPKADPGSGIWQPDDESEVSEENRQFWEATPSGELFVWYREQEAAPEPGSYVYIDCELAEDGGWQLETLTDHGDLCADVRLTMKHKKEGPVSGAKLELGIHNGEASKVFVGQVKTHWNVLIHEAK